MKEEGVLHSKFPMSDTSLQLPVSQLRQFAFHLFTNWCIKPLCVNSVGGNAFFSTQRL
jgi:hypothetical protein